MYDKFQYNVKDSEIAHDRLRWIFEGLREDVAKITPQGIVHWGQVPKPRHVGCQDIYSMLNKTLPCLQRTT